MRPPQSDLCPTDLCSLKHVVRTLWAGSWSGVSRMSFCWKCSISRSWLICTMEHEADALSISVVYKEKKFSPTPYLPRSDVFKRLIHQVRKTTIYSAVVYLLSYMLHMIHCECFGGDYNDLFPTTSTLAWTLCKKMKSKMTALVGIPNCVTFRK